MVEDIRIAKGRRSSNHSPRSIDVGIDNGDWGGVVVVDRARQTTLLNTALKDVGRRID